MSMRGKDETWLEANERARSWRHCVQLPVVAAKLESRAPLRALDLRRVGPDGTDVYAAEFANGAMDCGIGIARDGKVHTLWMLPA